MDVLVAENIYKSYKKDTYALNNATLNLKKGEILGLLGPNGAGKTTLIKILATLLNKDSGSVNIQCSASPDIFSISTSCPISD